MFCYHRAGVSENAKEGSFHILDLFFDEVNIPELFNRACSTNHEIYRTGSTGASDLRPTIINMNISNTL